MAETRQRYYAPELRSKRLTCREIREEDAEMIVKLRSAPEVYKYFRAPHKITLEEHLNWFNNSYVYNGDRFDWMAFDTEGNPVGVFGVRRESEDSDTAEVSYILAPEYYGKGYAGEALGSVMDFCRDEWKDKYAIAEIHVENAASIRFIEKCGYVRDEQSGSFVIYKKKL